jgi:outer membrane protein assembly factor BamB
MGRLHAGDQKDATSMLPSRIFLLIIVLAGLYTAPSLGDLYVSSFSQGSIRRYDESTGAFLGTFVTAGAGGLSAPHRGIFGPDGNFYVASANNDRVLRYNGQTGAFIDVFIQNGGNGLPANALDYPVDLAIGPDGALYVSSQLNDSVLRFNATTGAFLNVFVANGSGGLDGPSGIQFHNGDFFVAGRFSSRVYRYDGSTGSFELEFGTGQLNSAFGLDFGADGNLYVASGIANRIVRFNPETGGYLGDFVTSGSGGLSLPIGIEFGPGGDLFAASFNTDTVERYDGISGAALGDFVGAGSGGLDEPNFMTFAVPEPSTVATLGVAMFLLMRNRRGHRTRRSTACFSTRRDSTWWIESM